MMIPARKTASPAMSNGGMDSMAKTNPEIGGAPDEVERREGGDDRELAVARGFRLAHEKRSSVHAIGGVAVTAHFPEAELVFCREFDRLDELGAFQA